MWNKKIKTGKCYDCKHLVEKEDMQEVKVNLGSSRWFCPEHKKPYERIETPGYYYDYLFGYIDSGCREEKYYIKCNWLRVDEKGELVDYVRKEKKTVSPENAPEKKKRAYVKSGKYSKKVTNGATKKK